MSIEYVTVYDAAVRAKVTERTMMTRIANRDIFATKPGGRQWRIPTPALELFMFGKSYDEQKAAVEAAINERLEQGESAA